MARAARYIRGSLCVLTESGTLEIEKGATPGTQEDAEAWATDLGWKKPAPPPEPVKVEEPAPPAADGPLSPAVVERVEAIVTEAAAVAQIQAEASQASSPVPAPAAAEVELQPEPTAPNATAVEPAPAPAPEAPAEEPAAPPAADAPVA